MTRYNKSRYHDELDYEYIASRKLQQQRGPHFGKIVRWEERQEYYLGIVEGQRGPFINIYVFNRDKFGHRRTARKADALYIF